MATIAIGLTDIKLKLNDAAVGSAFASSTSIGVVLEGSTTLTQETPTETKIKGDYDDATVYTLYQAGDFSLETDIIEVDAEKISALTGATFAEATGIISLPASAPILTGELVLTFDTGITSMKIVKGQVIANLAWGNVKTEPFKVHLKVVALSDEAGYVDLVVPA